MIKHIFFGSALHKKLKYVALCLLLRILLSFISSLSSVMGTYVFASPSVAFWLWLCDEHDFLTCTLYKRPIRSFQGCVEFSFPPNRCRCGWGRKYFEGFENGGENQQGKNENKENWRWLIVLAVVKHDIWFRHAISYYLVPKHTVLWVYSIVYWIEKKISKLS